MSFVQVSYHPHTYHPGFPTDAFPNLSAQSSTRVCRKFNALAHLLMRFSSIHLKGSSGLDAVGGVSLFSWSSEVPEVSEEAEQRKSSTGLSI